MGRLFLVLLIRGGGVGIDDDQGDGGADGHADAGGADVLAGGGQGADVAGGADVNEGGPEGDAPAAGGKKKQQKKKGSHH